jgi:hypothetical protein
LGASAFSAFCGGGAASTTGFGAGVGVASTFAAATLVGGAARDAVTVGLCEKRSLMRFSLVAAAWLLRSSCSALS